MAIVLGTNSFVTVAEAEDYFATVLDSSGWDALDEAGKEAALISATRLIDNRSWIGTAVSSSQSLGWPRSGATYFDARLGLTVSPTNDEIPNKVKAATFEQALHLITNQDALQASGQVFESITVGPISLSDSNKTSKPSNFSATALSYLEGLFTGSKGTGGGTGSAIWRAN